MSKNRGGLRRQSPVKWLIGLLPVLAVTLALVAALSGAGVARATESEDAAQIETSAGNEETLAGATDTTDSAATVKPSDNVAKNTKTNVTASDEDASSDSNTEMLSDGNGGQDEQVTAAAVGPVYAPAADANTMKPKDGAPTVDFFDYWTGYSTNNGLINNINTGHAFNFIPRADYNTSYNRYSGSRAVTQGIVADNLGSDGYPYLNNSVVTIGPNRSESLGYLFGTSTDTNVVKSYIGVSGLFYDDNGYFAYDSQQHAATLNSDGTVTVSRDPKSDGAKFMPLDSLAGGTDYHFGMKMTTDFLMPEGGKVNNNNMVFEFSGDDDVWVFVDGKLVLDLGGIHGNAGGRINFATGSVTYNDDTGNTKETNLWKLLGSTNGNKPDSWGDYTTHKLSFFYLERGAGGSNCKLRFNLPSIPEGSFDFGKAVVYANMNNASDIDFQFKAYVNTDGTAKTVGEVGKFSLYTGLYDVYNSSDLQHVVTREATDGIITLKDGQFARLNSSETLPIYRTSKYYVQEVGATSDKYSVTLAGTTNTDGKQDLDGYTSALQTVKDALHVTFSNKVQVDNAFNVKVQKTVKDSAGNVVTPSGSYTMFVKIGSNPYSGSYTVFGSDGNKVKDDKTTDGKIKLEAGQCALIQGIVGGNSVTVSELDADGNAFTGDATYTAPTYELTGTTGSKTKTENGVTTTVTESASTLNGDASQIYEEGTTTPSLGVTATANEGNNLPDGALATAVVTNTMRTAKFTLTKVDSENNDTKLAGAKFTLTQGEGNNLKYVQADGTLSANEHKFTTGSDDDAKGTFSISGLLPGDYTITETDAPTGYDKPNPNTHMLHIAYTQDENGNYGLGATLNGKSDNISVTTTAINVTVSNTRSNVTLTVQKNLSGPLADTTKTWTVRVTDTAGNYRDVIISDDTADNSADAAHKFEVTTLDHDKDHNTLTAPIALKYGDKVSVEEIGDTAGYNTTYTVGTANPVNSISNQELNGDTTITVNNEKTNIVITGIKSAGVPGALTAVAVAAFTIVGGMALLQRNALESATTGAHTARGWHRRTNHKSATRRGTNLKGASRQGSHMRGGDDA